MSTTPSASAASTGTPGRAAASVDATVTHLRSDSDTCICCTGPHVFAYSLTAHPGTPDRLRLTHPATSTLLDGLDEQRFIDDFIRAQPDGTRIRITVETLPADPATSQT